MIRTAAIQAGIWEHVNPDTKKEDLLICEELEEQTHLVKNFET
jgi:hypothetical protein